MKRILFLCLFVCATATALAQSRNASAPVTWEADDQTLDTNAKTVTTSGNVIVTQGDMRLRADEVRIEGFDGSSADRLVANSRVVVDAPAIGTASGDAAVYDVARRIITFTGKVVLTKDKNVMRGTVLTYSLDTNQAKFSAPSGRVQGLFTPPPQSNASP